MKWCKLISLFLLTASHAFTQAYFRRVPTQFDKFIKQTNIEWAAYANDSIRFNNVNLSALLRQRFHKGEIKASNFLFNSQANKITYVSENFITKQLLAYAIGDPIYDSLGNIPDSYYQERKPPYRLDSSVMNLLLVTQIFYIENKKLQSYISWVAPQLSVFTASEIRLGSSDNFNTCFNFKYNFKSAATDKLISLGTTHKKMNLDSLSKSDMLKELYGKNLIETLWEDLAGSKNKMINIETGDTINLKKLHEFSIAVPVSVPFYDSLGNVIYGKTYQEPTSPSAFKEIEITQHWFYNSTKNIVVNNITEITLFAEKFTGINKAEELKPTVKIIFK